MAFYTGEKFKFTFDFFSEDGEMEASPPTRFLDDDDDGLSGDWLI